MFHLKREGLTDLSQLKSINYILERDSKDTTYKFALLRSVIDAVQYYDHLKKEEEDAATFPLGVLIEKWILYYYPLIESNIPQKHGENNTKGRTLAFKKYFDTICNYYRDKGGFNFFYNEYKKGIFHKDIKQDFLKLLKSLKNTITNMPMKYLGNSYFKKYYSVFKYNHDSKITEIPEALDVEYIIRNFGTFSFSKELYVVFKYLGSFMNGTESIIYKWAEFSANADKNKVLTVEKVLDKLLITPETERDVLTSKVFFEKLLHEKNELECIWSGKKIVKNLLNIDHILPFSIWKNNDLWNLLPVHKAVNSDKKDKIPSPDLIEMRKNIIHYYWKLLSNQYVERFQKEIYYDLVGNDEKISPIDSLKNKANYLINIRGYEEWNLTK